MNRKVVARSIAVSTSLLLSSHAFASETRTSVIGKNAVKDNTDLFLYPTSALDKEFVLAEIGTAGSTQAYGLISKKIGSGQLAVAFSHHSSLLTNQNYGAAVSLADAWLNGNTSNTNAAFLLPNPERPIDIVYALKMGKNRLGFGLSMAGYKSTSSNGSGPTASTTSEASQMVLNIGYRLAGKNPLDISFKTTLVGDLSRKIKTAAGTTENSFDESTKRFALTVRSIKKRSHYGLIEIESRKPDLVNSTATTDKKAVIDETMINLSGGAILSPMETTLIYAGIGMSFLKSKGPVIPTAGAAAAPSFATTDDQVTIDTKAIGANIGLESKVSESFGIMGGMSYALWGRIVRTDKITANDPKTEVSITQTPDAALWALGLYYKADALRIDASYANSFLYAGPFFISGNARAGTAPMFTQISMTYAL